MGDRGRTSHAHAGNFYGELGQQHKYGQEREEETEKDPPDGGSSENSKTSVRGSFRTTHNRSPFVCPITRSANHRRLQLRDEEIDEGGDSGENIGGLNLRPNGGESINEKDFGVMNMSQPSNEHCLGGEKNIYVGQWDSIKEKMVWATVDKGEAIDGMRGGGIAGSRAFNPPSGQNEVSPNFVFGKCKAHCSTHVSSPKSKKTEGSYEKAA